MADPGSACPFPLHRSLLHAALNPVAPKLQRSRLTKLVETLMSGRPCPSLKSETFGSRALFTSAAPAVFGKQSFSPDPSDSLIQIQMAASPAWDVFSVPGMVAVVTGGGTGLGLMMAKALEANGAKKVYIIGRRWDVLEKAAKQSKYGKICPLPGDVTENESLKFCAEFIRAREGYINLLITCAGKGGTGHWEDKTGFKTIEAWQEFFLKQNPADYTETFHVNVTSFFFSVISFLHLLDAGNKKKNYGPQSQVISMASVGGYARGLHGSFDYAISKAAVRQWTQSLATHFAPYQIRFNALALGGFRSELTAGSPLFQGTNPRAEDFGSVPITMMSVGRLGREVEAAGAVLYLASPAGAYSNGAVLLAEGGIASLGPSTYG